jgi:hypothetical protein
MRSKRMTTKWVSVAKGCIMSSVWVMSKAGATCFVERLGPFLRHSFAELGFLGFLLLLSQTIAFGFLSHLFLPALLLPFSMSETIFVQTLVDVIKYWSGSSDLFMASTVPFVSVQFMPKLALILSALILATFSTTFFFF